MSATTIATDIQSGAAVCALSDGTIAVAHGPGRVLHLDRSGTVLDELDVDPAPVALAPHPTSNGVLGLAPATGLWEFRFDTAGVAALNQVRGGRGMVVDPVSSTALVCRTPGGGELVSLPLVAGSTPRRTVADGFGRSHAVAARPGGTSAWVLVGGAARSLVEIDLAGGTGVGHQIFGLGDASAVAWTGTTGTVLAVAGPSGRIVLVDTARPSAAPDVLATGLEPVWALDLLPPLAAGDPPLLLVGVGEAVALFDVPEPVSEVVLELPTTPLYMSGWARVGVTLTGGRTLDDLVLAIEPPEGGTISVSADATFANRPAAVLSASGMPGRYDLIAHDRATGDKLAVASYEITDAWNGVDGPPVAVIGEHGIDAPDPAWGGGDPNLPQNLDVVPQRGTRGVAVVVVESGDLPAMTPAEQNTLRSEWQDEIFDGVVRDGVTESTRAYIRNVSDGALDIQNAGVVTVRLPGTWTSYAPTADNAVTGKTADWSGFARAVIADLRRQNEAAADAGNPPVVDLTTVFSVILVIRSLPATPATPTTPAMTGRFMWPSATIPGGYQLSFEIGRRPISLSFPWGTIVSTVPITRTINMFSMPDDWETRAGNGGRMRRETSTHELGHNLGLPDEYARDEHGAAFKARDLAGSKTRGDSWSLMSWEQRFPQLTVVEKMMLGWIKAGHVRNLSFATLGPVDEDIVLHASDAYPPPAGEFAAAEVRISDGINYYFEYRREDATQTSDPDIPADDTVFGVHCWSGKEPKDHRNILRIQNDPDNDQAEFQVGDDYREADTSDPSYPNDFTMKVLSTGDDSATIHITYGDKKPDPQIRPWAPSTNWKSPDLQITNARNQADSRYRDIPWEGHDNRLVATVRNPAGQLNARGVRVNFFVKDYTLGSGAERSLGSDVRDVPAGAQVQFTSSVAWVPPPLSMIPFVTIPVHYCVVARIAEYDDPITGVGEITRDNNEAQSNHTQVISVSSSPSTRETGFVKVANPLPVTANCRVQVRQTSAFSRTYLEHAWLRLAPGEQRDVMFLTESMLEDPVVGPWAAEHGGEEIYEVPNSVRLTGIVDHAEVCHGLVTGGAQVLVRSARATRFVNFELQGGTAVGEVRAVDNDQGVNGEILLSMWPPGAPEKGRVAGGPIDNGFFEFNPEPQVEDGMVLQAHYLGQFDLGPCDSRILER